MSQVPDLNEQVATIKKVPKGTHLIGPTTTYFEIKGHKYVATRYPKGSKNLNVFKIDGKTVTEEEFNAAQGIK